MSSRETFAATVAALPTCGARTRSGAPCRNARMRGRRRCRMHGGASLRGFAHPSVTHGLYSADVFTRTCGAASIARLGKCLDGTPIERGPDGRLYLVSGPEAGVSDRVAQPGGRRTGTKSLRDSADAG